MRIRTGFISVVVAVGLLALAAPGASGVASAAAERHQAGPAVVAAGQQYWWEWSDGSSALHRTFTQARYGVQSNLPHLVTHAAPARPSRVVVLQYWQHGAWHFENSVRTNSQGIAVMDIDPYCSNNTWCDGTWKYRMKIGTQLAYVTITYAEK